MILNVRIGVRRYAPETDRGLVDGLWVAAMPPQWPLLPAGVAGLCDGLIAESAAGPVGMAAIDTAGSVPLILVTPGWRRRGIGSKLLAEAADVLRASGARDAGAGGGGSSYIWPGVPRDCPGAVEFFAACGWRYTHDVADLVADLRGYQFPADALVRAAEAGCSITEADTADTDAVLRFERATFPSWTRWFADGNEGILIARTCCSRARARTVCSRRCSGRPAGP
jgi:GNAT superfamily N-acetyltransferase